MGTIINSNSIISEACVINSGSIVEHDCNIDFSTHLCPGVYLAGNVYIGKYSFVGIGSRIIQNIKVLKSYNSAGSIILKDIKKFPPSRVFTVRDEETCFIYINF